MDRSSKAVISQVLVDSVTPLLKRHGFDRRSPRTYDRARDGRRELINVQPNKWNNRYGGSFTINLGIYIPEVDSILSLHPMKEAPESYECRIQCRIGDVKPDGRMGDHKDTWRGWWEFDAATDLSAFNTEVCRWVEHNALGFFDCMRTGSGMLAWLRRLPAEWMGLREVVLAVYAGEPTFAQECLDVVVAQASPGPNRMLRQAAHVAGRLRLACPAPTDNPALTAVFRLAAGTTPQGRESAFHRLEHKFSQYVELFRDVLPIQDPARLYFTTEYTSDACTVMFYGAAPEDLLRRLRRAFERLSELFAEITWHVHPAAPQRD